MAMDTTLAVTLSDGEYRIDSRLVARSLDIEHKHVLETVQAYLAELETLGQLPFETAVGYRKQGGGNPTKYALLNEDQAIFLATLSRNTTQVVAFKLQLTRAFSQVRARAVEQSHQSQSAIHRYSQALMQRLLPELQAPIPPGFFSIVSEIVRNLAALEILLDGSTLDVSANLEKSIADTWATYCEEVLELPASYRRRDPGYAVKLASGRIIHPWIYDLRYQTTHLQWMWNIYFPVKFPAYQQHRARYIGLPAPQRAPRKQLAGPKNHPAQREAGQLLLFAEATIR